MPYMPAKAGVLHLVRHVALELAEFGIRVNAIAPGPFVTNIGDGWVKKDPAAKAAWDKTIPLGGDGRDLPDQAAGAVSCLGCLSYHDRRHVLIDGGVALGNFR